MADLLSGPGSKHGTSTCQYNDARHQLRECNTDLGLQSRRGAKRTYGARLAFQQTWQQSSRSGRTARTAHPLRSAHRPKPYLSRHTIISFCR